MINPLQLSIFQQGSRTYFYSSLFFPSDVRADVFSLYAFVRVADDFVDSIPQQSKEFFNFKSQYETALKGAACDDIVINRFVEMIQRKKIDPELVQAFLSAMEQDLSKTTYSTLAETEQYMYGSANVIGLMMTKILNLPADSYHAAEQLGKAMQYCNFIRDISEDLRLGRQYLPTQELEKYDLPSLRFEDIVKKRTNFEQFMHAQIAYYRAWQREAEKGYSFIPKRYLIPIKTAAVMYLWTMMQVEKDPLLVYCKKVKPNIARILKGITQNAAGF